MCIMMLVCLELLCLFLLILRWTQFDHSRGKSSGRRYKLKGSSPK